MNSNNDTPKRIDDVNDDVNTAAREKHDPTAPGFVSHEDTTGEQVVGTVGGAAVGAAWGMLAGPIGSIVGGLAGAVGGWWAARSATEQHLFNGDDDGFYRDHYTKTASEDMRKARSYDSVRPGYQLGHLAGTNPEYASRSFDEIEPHLRTAYDGKGEGNWDDIRGYAHDAYVRGQSVRHTRTGMPTIAQIDDSLEVNDSMSTVGRQTF